MPPKAAAAAKKKASGGSTGKKLTGYQAFMKKEIKALKASNPGLDHKEAFKKAAANWKTSSENPAKK